MLRLTITADDRVRHVPLNRDGAMHVGSAADNEIVIAATGVSRHHARIEHTSRSVVIVDTNSKNGIVLGNRRVKDARLVPGDLVRLGAASLLLEEVSTADADVAIAFGGESSSGAYFTEGETDTATAGNRGPAAALQWARHVEQRSALELARDLSSLLEDARAIVRAEALLLVDTHGAELGIVAAAGPLPGDAETADLMKGLSSMWLRAGNVAARLAPAARSAWKREFLEFVDAKLRGPSQDRVPSRAAVPASLPPQMVAGTSAAMRALLADVARVARASIDVLILGETGTGKELVARAIHLSSTRARAPFIAVNCAAVSKELLEAELFGIGRGIATGVDARPGLFAAANGGTIFLDEIGEMPESLQAKLLRVLQEREVLPVGATRPRAVDVRVISSTNRELKLMVDAGAFRPDLYYRLRGIEVRVPSLRARPEDVAPLVHFFATNAAAAAHKRIRGVSRKALASLVACDWPGNVRELRSTVEAAVVRCPDGGTIQESHLSLAPAGTASPAAPAMLLTQRIEDTERAAIVNALRECSGNKSRAARLLGITRAGLYLKIKRHGIE
ncbi:MAG TPA: sigma 54-interacting transcriptional regulator [Thermoanaerobaculia bacterium]|nr:sigma 54-interacting transcriptional regulator [Thermoanaerobaculia bacterium]